MKLLDPRYAVTKCKPFIPGDTGIYYTVKYLGIWIYSDKNLMKVIEFANQHKASINKSAEELRLTV